MSHDGIQMGLGSIMKLSDAETRSITAENVYGGKGRGGMADVGSCQEEVRRIGQPWSALVGSPARELGRGWKVRPYIDLPPLSTTALMDVDGPGVIQHIWITAEAGFYRDLVIRMYWDGESEPSVEAPLGDFFCNGWKTRANILALPINVNPSGGFNCYFPMPFRRHARITIENRADSTCCGFYYAIDYALAQVGHDDAYFHAQFRRVNRLADRTDYTILDGVRGRGHYVGTYMAWQQTEPGWWGEGEIKFFLDGDGEYPTICGTGTEDYFGGAWCFGENYSAPFLGYPAGSSDGRVGNRHSLYRFHIMDPVRFRGDLRVTMQSLGWQSGGRFLHQRDDIASVAYWYQSEPHCAFPALPDRTALDVANTADPRSGYLASWTATKPAVGLCDLASLPAPGDRTAWRSLISDPAGTIDPSAQLMGAEGLTYLSTMVELDLAGPWTLIIGHDDGVRLFVDGVPIYTATTMPAQSTPQARIRVRARLAAGMHRIDIACMAGDAHALSLRLEGPVDGRMPDGKPRHRCIGNAAATLDQLSQADIMGGASLHGEMLVFVPGTDAAAAIDLQSIRTPPRELGGALPVRMRMGPSGLDLAEALGGEAGAAALIVHEFTVAGDGPTTLGFSGDWWIDACIDGTAIHTSGSLGNGHGVGFKGLLKHLVHVQLAPGRHLLAIRFRRGSRAAILRVDGPADLRAETA